MKAAQAPASETAAAVQAHLVRASKFDGQEKPRNWSLFFFFRILSAAEFAASEARFTELRSRVNEEREGADSPFSRELALDFAEPASLSGGAAEQAEFDIALPLKATENDTEDGGDDTAAASDRAGVALSLPMNPPCDAFRGWLKVLADGDTQFFLAAIERLARAAQAPVAAEKLASLETSLPLDTLALINHVTTVKLALDFIEQTLFGLRRAENYNERLTDFGADPAQAGRVALERGLLGLCTYEMLRQGAPSFQAQGIVQGPTALRSEWEQDVLKSSSLALASERLPGVDRTPINIAFTHAGLAAAGVEETTLASFPEAFKQGMAARAHRLGDTGSSAPECWDGELGLKSVHGYYTGGFAIDDTTPIPEQLWKNVRDQIRGFNNPASDADELLRYKLGALFRSFGIEVVHIELGQDPYNVDEGGNVQPLPQRYEHFGFRDGLSQPWVDLGLADPSYGGGTARRNRTWAPVAPGELFLNEKDEEQNEHLGPLPADLRAGSTFVVFRKLEQDVVGFRYFLSRERQSKKEQEKLAAQFVGRWPNGVPLVLSPHESGVAMSEDVLNDFLYAADDPRGEKCPLSAHIRRANPRDIGGRDNVRRHRVLRRGISYGGPLLPPESIGDGSPRGLLFIAANARIDLQFEVLQADWLNHGEFLGQAGLGRCPLTGANSGAPSDTFLESGAAVPVRGLPRFVLTKGGDYFFAPGKPALRRMASDQLPVFPTAEQDTPYCGHSMADARTNGVFSEKRVRQYIEDFIYKKARVRRVTLPPVTGLPVTPPRETVAFIGQHADVQAVLANADDFSVPHYYAAGREMTRGDPLLVGTASGSEERVRLRALLDEAWRRLRDAGSGADTVRTIASERLDTEIRRLRQSRRVDLVQDLAAQATYAVVEKVLGVPGPSWLTELAISLPFSKQHIGDLHPEWLRVASGGAPDNASLATIQVWSILILTDLLGNPQNQLAAGVLARQAATELLNHIDMLLLKARAEAPKKKRIETLVDAFAASQHWYERKFPKEDHPCADFKRDAAVLLLELVGTTMASIPLMFASVMTTTLTFRINLSALKPLLDAPAHDGVSGWLRFLYEAERFNPNLPIIMRRCEKTTSLDGQDIKQGDWVAGLIAAANFDQLPFTQPMKFSLYPRISGHPERKMENYLTFGGAGSDRRCWGRAGVAVVVLEECLKAAARLRRLRAVAGPQGGPKKLLAVTIGLPARFTAVS